MELMQQPWGCGNREHWSVAEWRRVGASENCRLVMCDLSFVENAGLSRKLTMRFRELQKGKHGIFALPKFLVCLYELVHCLKKLRYSISLPFLSLSLIGSIPIQLSATSNCSPNRRGSSTVETLAIAHEVAPGGVVARRVGAAVVITVAEAEFEVDPEGIEASYEAGSLLNTVAFAFAYIP
jgi:hypothetical protein